MTASGSNSDLPAGLTEADLIDLVDGVLSPEREGVVLAALKKYPHMGLLAKQFRADRLMVATLSEVRAPSGMAEGVEARLEAAALRDLASQSRAVPQPIPVSHVHIRETGALRLLMESPWTRRLATAASLAIMCGLGLIGMRAIYNALPGKAIVHNASPSNSAPELAPEPAPTIELAHKPVQEPPTPAPVTVTAASRPESDELTNAVAARLAAEGRLSITVRTSITGPSLKRLESLAKARDTGWHLIPLDAPEQYAMLLVPQVEAAAPHPAQNPVNPITVAGGDPVAPTAPTLHTAPLLPTSHTVVKAMYTVDVTPGEHSFASLLRSITDTLPEGATISLRTLPQPIASPVALEPESVLWWTSSTGKWSKRTRVPIVIEAFE